MGSHEFFRKSSDRHDTATERNLTGHGIFCSHSLSCYQRGQGGYQSNTCRWSVFRHSSRRNVNVKIPFLQDLCFFGKQRFYQSQGNLDRLFHYISKLSGDEEISFSFHQLAFDKEDLAACGGPGKACNYTRLLFLQTGLMTHTLMSQVFRQVFFSNR